MVRRNPHVGRNSNRIPRGWTVRFPRIRRTWADRASREFQGNPMNFQLSSYTVQCRWWAIRRDESEDEDQPVYRCPIDPAPVPVGDIYTVYRTCTQFMSNIFLDWRAPTLSISNRVNCFYSPPTNCFNLRIDVYIYEISRVTFKWNTHTLIRKWSAALDIPLDDPFQFCQMATARREYYRQKTTQLTLFLLL